MREPDLIELFVEPLNRLGLDYMVSGAIAAIIYGEPRLTNDIDIVAHLKPADARRLVREFSSPEFYVPPEEVIQAELARSAGGHFNLIPTAR